MAELDKPEASAVAAAPEGEEAEARPSPERSWVPIAVALVVPLAFFFFLPPLTRAGLWDPHELNVADLARRIALNLHGAADLALEGADNSLPHLNDLGRPQLPFTSIALGFKAFGLHEWAGRAPLAVWGLAGVLATYAFVTRLIDRRAGVFSAVAMTTMPIYFVQARTMLGDIVTMSAFAMAFGGLAVTVFGRRDEEPHDVRTRAMWLFVAGVGLVSGYYARGALVSVAAPMLGVGVAWALAMANGEKRFDALALATGGLAAALGLGIGALALLAVANTDRNADLSPLVGAMIRIPARYPTFDFEIGHIAQGLLPWSAFAPFAFGRLFLAPSSCKTDGAFQRESTARLALLVGAGVAFAAHGWIAARTDMMAFAAPSILAAACGVALRDYDRGAHPSVAVGVGTAALLGLLHHELHDLPEKAFNAFAISGATFPESFKTQSLSIWNVVLVGFAGIVFLTFAEGYRPRHVLVTQWIWSPLGEPAREPFETRGYLKVLLALRDAWDGMLALAYFAMVAGASLAGLAVWVGTRQHAKWLPQLGTQMRDVVLNAWWLTAFVPLGVIFGIFFWADVWLWTFERARPLAKSSLSRGFEPFEALAAELKGGRLRETVPKLVMGKLVVTNDALEDGLGPMALFILAPLLYLMVPGAVFFALYKAGLKTLIAAALAIPSGVALFLVLGFLGDLLRGQRAAFLSVFGTAVGAGMCLAYYPALANQLSPKEVFESYQRVHHGNEPLALFGVGGRTAAYYAGGQPLILRDTNSAYDWLMGAEGGSRRFLAVRSEELARLNRAWREHKNQDNLPVLDARSSQIILVASRLEAGEKNQSPIAKIVLASPPPKVQHRTEANMDDKLEVLGYDITDDAGRIAEHIAPGKKYHMKTYFKVLAPMTTEWDMFIHIDGFHRRHNGDHKICEGKYPMSLWLPGDVIADDYGFTLEPNFSPGQYTNFFGLFVGESRLPVKSGPSDGSNRINGGSLNVR